MTTRGSFRKECPIDFDRLAMSPDSVAALTRPEREARVLALVAESYSIFEWGRAAFITDEDRVVRAVVTLFSGGNDSTVLAHLFRSRATHAAHANTGVGIEATRQYVRDVCADWGLPLLERKAPREEDSYRHHVERYGFPGPGAHYKMFQRLKERALDAIRGELVLYPRRERVIFVAGRRRTESARRNSVPEMERIGSTVWISPLINWTKQDMNTYRLMCAAGSLPGGAVPVNVVADLIHMSGECLCGAYAHYQEREEISEWYADAFDDIAALEAYWADKSEDWVHPDLVDAYYRKLEAWNKTKNLLGRTKVPKPSVPGPVPMWARKWGWSGDPELVKRSGEKPKASPLCQSCSTRYEESLVQELDQLLNNVTSEEIR